MQSSRKKPSSQDPVNNALNDIYLHLKKEINHPAFDYKNTQLNVFGSKGTQTITVMHFLASMFANIDSREQLDILLRYIDSFPQMKHWRNPYKNVAIRDEYSEEDKTHMTAEDERAKKIIKEKNDIGFTLLHFATLNPHIIDEKPASTVLIEKLLEKGYDLHDRRNYQTLTPLHFCIHHSSAFKTTEQTTICLNNIFKLLKAGAKLNNPKNLELIDLLMIHGATIHLYKLLEKDGHELNVNEAYLSCSELNKLEKLVYLDLITKPPIDVDLVGMSNSTPLMEAARKNNLDVVEYLAIERKADLTFSVKRNHPFAANALTSAIEADAKKVTDWLIAKCTINELYIPTNTEEKPINIIFYLHQTFQHLLKSSTKSSAYDDYIIKILKKLAAAKYGAEKDSVKKMLEETWEGCNALQLVIKNKRYTVVDAMIELKLITFNDLFNNLSIHYDDSIPKEHLERYWKSLKAECKEEDDALFSESIYSILTNTIHNKATELCRFILSKCRHRYLTSQDYQKLADIAEKGGLLEIKSSLLYSAEKINRKISTNTLSEEKAYDFVSPSQSSAKSGLAVLSENLGTEQAKVIRKQHHEQRKKNKKHTKQTNGSTTSNASLEITEAESIAKAETQPDNKVENKPIIIKIEPKLKENKSSFTTVIRKLKSASNENSFKRAASIFKQGNEAKTDLSTYAYMLTCEKNDKLDAFLTQLTTIHSIKKYNQKDGYHITLIDIGHNSNMDLIFSKPETTAQFRREAEELIKEAKIDILSLKPFKFSAFGATKETLVIELKDTENQLVKLNAALKLKFEHVFKMEITSPFNFIPHITIGHSSTLSAELLKTINKELKQNNPHRLSVRNCVLNRKIGWTYSDPEVFHAIDFEKVMVNIEWPVASHTRTTSSGDDSEQGLRASFSMS